MLEPIAERYVGKLGVEVGQGDILRDLRNSFALTRLDNEKPSYYMLYHVNELTKSMTLLADCGLQRDIRRRIGDGYLSFNSAWFSGVDQTKLLSYFYVSSDGGGPLVGQLEAVFKNHPIVGYKVLACRVDSHDWIVYLHAVGRLDDPSFDGDDARNAQIVSDKIYYTILRDRKAKDVGHWEKAVHELASPLDFIYSNSDFLIKWLTSDELEPEFRKQKLEDFKLISTLLINRLHQFRYAVCGIPKEPHVERFDVFEACMPITHLWYHEAEIKHIKFKYDGLRQKPWINTDKELFQAIMFNLVSNAIKYSYHNTEITLGSVVGGGAYVISVTNIGVQIDDDERNLIFNAHYRGRHSSRIDARGMGLGLFVSRQIANTLGGALRLEESVSKDLITFSLRLRED